MRAVDIISKKRDGGELSTEEIRFFIEGFTSGEIPDYQASAWAMAVLCRGMTGRETFDLTMAMVDSGIKLDLSEAGGCSVDKHSTGGIGDKTTLVVGPVVAACGLPVAKMSGRGLGISGGTLDKMESIPGFRVELTADEILRQLREIGFVLCGQTADLTPADGKLYSLRDASGSVPSIPLIASSVMSKKIAGGAQAVVLDVKVGSGAFMPDLATGMRLALTMVDLGRRAGRRVVALLSDMNQPLGEAVGNALELREAIEMHQGKGPGDLRAHSIRVAGYMLLLGGKAKTMRSAEKIAAEALASGRSLRKLEELVHAQGGETRFVQHPDLLPRATLIETVVSPHDGYVAWADAGMIGTASVRLGAGRSKKGDPIDHSVGLVVHHKVGDRVHKGDALFTVHANDPGRAQEAIDAVLAAHKFSRRAVKPLPLFYRTLRS
jgi:pyrimidine-nucleoside phosphorylase